MYYPYLRGKQFELIALRELEGLLEKKRAKVSPVIEPVKDSTTLKNTLKKLREKEINFSVIVNPQVGDLTGRISRILKILEEHLNGYENFQPAVILTSKTNIGSIIKTLSQYDLSAGGLTVVHNCEITNIEDLLNKIEHDYKPVLNNIINFQLTSRRYPVKFQEETRVSLDDYFHSKERNKDYLAEDDSSFSEEHLYFEEDGYKGFGDFQTIGDTYSETGALPYAVAIHISYVTDDDKIRVKHFVSDSNDDQSDVAGKFGEALEKLVQWADENHIKTQAVDEFRELFLNGHFPGLGSIKKLAIMNHIEVVLSLL